MTDDELAYLARARIDSGVDPQSQVSLLRDDQGAVVGLSRHIPPEESAYGLPGIFYTLASIVAYANSPESSEGGCDE